MIWDETCDTGGKPDTEHCIECGQEITEGDYYMSRSAQIIHF